MSDTGIKAAALSPRLFLANPIRNANIQAEEARKAAEKGCNLIVFPAMSLTGSTCGDLIRSQRLKRASAEAVELLARETADLDAVIVTGVYDPEAAGHRALIIHKGKVRTVEAGPVDTPLLDFMVFFGNCQVPDTYKIYEKDEIVLMDASPMKAGDGRMLLLRMAELSEKTGCRVIYAGSGPWESTAGAIYGGQCIIAENGRILASSPALAREGSRACAALGTGAEGVLPAGKPFEFSDKDPFMPLGNDDAREYCLEILEMQAAALAERLQRSYSQKAIVGVSGGSDSTLALLASARAMELLGRPSSEVLAVTMPGFGTSSRTKGNAYAMMEALGCEIREIPIGPAVLQHFKDIGQDPELHDVTYENAQARERTQILMDLANRDGGLVVGTGDMSEAALGWCTYNGDHMAMYSVNCSLTKGLVKGTIRAAAEALLDGTSRFSPDKDAKKLAACLLDVLDTPVSPELLPTDEKGQIAQITEDKVGPYELHDLFLFHTLRGEDPDEILDLAEKAFAGSYDRETVAKWLKTFMRRFFSQQFKRNCSPEGPNLTGLSLSPRGDWDMPSDADGSLWQELRA